MPKFNVGDLVKINPDKYSSYYSIDRYKNYEVSSTRDGPNGQLIKLRSDNYPNTEYKSINFKMVKANPNAPVSTEKSIFLVFRLTPSIIEGENWTIEDSKMSTFTSEKEAKEAVRARLEDDPELVFGVFPLGFVGKVEKPPIKFDYIWKK